MTQYDSILFDNDGVLVNKTPFGEPQRREIRRTLKEHGVLRTNNNAINTFMPPFKPETIQQTCMQYRINTDSFWHDIEERFSALQQRQIDRGEKTLFNDVDTLRSLPVDRYGIVSNNQQATIDYIVKQYSLDSLFQTHYGREPQIDGLRRRKPSPYYLEKAINDLGVENPLFVGDSECDIKAALTLGIDAAWINRPHHDTAIDITPTHEIQSLDDLASLV